MKLAASASWHASRRLEKLWQRITGEWQAEKPLLVQKGKWILLGILFQYLHGVGTRTAHFLHQPGPLLHDMGFVLIPELGKERGVISEWIFLGIFIPFIIWTFHPFVCREKKFYTCLLWVKTLATLAMCQSFRILSFTATQLPGPNYHCRLGSPTAKLANPNSVLDLFRLNVMFGCGDLIFSSHMTFTITSVITYAKYGEFRLVKAFGFLLLIVQSVLIVAARKHYSVDVVVAWYVVPLVFFFIETKLGDHVLAPSSKEIAEWSPRHKALLPLTISDKLPPVQQTGTNGSIPNVLHVMVEPSDIATSGASPLLLKAVHPPPTATPESGYFRGVLLMWDGRAIAQEGLKDNV